MNQYVADTRIVNGHLRLDNIPILEDVEVKVIIIPKANLAKMSFRKVQELTKSIKGDLADDVISDRDAR